MKLVRHAWLLAFLSVAAIGSTSALAQCEPRGSVEFICGFKAPEDLISVPNSSWLVGAGLGESGSGGALYLIDTKTRAVSTIFPQAGANHDRKTYAACPGAPDEKAFSAHGIDLRRGSRGQHTLYVINHGGRESLEVFTLDTSGQAPKLTWIGCVVYPEGTSGNSVAALPDGGFATTNFLDPRDKEAFPKMARREITGNVLEWSPSKGWTTVPDSALSGANGIVASPDGKWLYVASWPTKRVIRFSRANPAAPKRVFETGFLTDNLRWARDGSIMATGHDSEPPGQDNDLAKLFACRPPAKCFVTTIVARIDPQLGRSTKLLRLPGDERFQGGTTAIQIGDRFWIGSYRGDRIAVVPVSFGTAAGR
jgi:hypothetical protein